MNYLAHCYLSCTNEDVLLGNFITDFMTKKEENIYTDDVLEGIRLHRKIDQFTDEHEASIELRSLLRRNHKKYAPVVVDLIWDRALSKNWSHYSGADLKDFSKDVYTILLNRRQELPAKLDKRIDEMIDSDFLGAYSDNKRMLKSLEWMDRRVSFPSNFTEALTDYLENENLINDLFSRFFPEAIAYVEQECLCL